MKDKARNVSTTMKQNFAIIFYKLHQFIIDFFKWTNVWWKSTPD